MRYTENKMSEQSLYQRKSGTEKVDPVDVYGDGEEKIQHSGKTLTKLNPPPSKNSLTAFGSSQSH